MRLHSLNRPVSRLANPGWLQLFADPPAPNPDDTPTPGGEKGEKVKVEIGGKPKPADPPAPAPITFPDQATLQARLDRATESGKKALAKELGFESVEAMATAAKAAKAAEEAAKTEAQRQTEALAAEKKRADDAEAARTETQTKSDQKIIKSELRSLARLAGAIDVEDVLKLMDSKDTQLDEEGNVTGAQEAIDALKAAKPHLFGTAKPPAPNIGGPMNPPKTPSANMLDASQEEFAEGLRKLGLRPHSSTVPANQPNRKG